MVTRKGQDNSLGKPRLQDRLLRDGIEDTPPMLEAGEAAYQVALDRNVDGLAELNDPLYTSCITCHEHDQPGFS